MTQNPWDQQTPGQQQAFGPTQPPQPPPPQPQPPQPQPPGGMLHYHVPAPQRPKGMAIASMVLGICSLAFCFLPYVNFCTTPILAILAVVFGILGRNAARRGEADGEGMAMAGLVMGIISLSLIGLVMLLLILGIGLAGLGAGA